MAITNVSLSINNFLYLNSLAISTFTGILPYSSIKCLPIKPACIALPQATIVTFLYFDKSGIPLITSLLSSSIYSFIIFLVTSGCSWISFSIYFS